MGFADSSMDFSNIADLEPVFRKIEKKIQLVVEKAIFYGIEPNYDMLKRKMKYKSEWAVFATFPELLVYFRKLTDLSHALAKMDSRNMNCQHDSNVKSRFLPIKEYQVTSSAPYRCVLCYRPIPNFENVYLETFRIEELFSKIFLILGIPPSVDILNALVKRATSHPLLKCFDFEDEVVHLCRDHFNYPCDIDDYGFVKETYTIIFNSELFLITYEMMVKQLNQQIESSLQEPLITPTSNDDQTESECLSLNMSMDMDENADTQSEFSIEEIPLPQIDMIPMPTPSPVLINIPLPSEGSSVASTILNTSSDMEISDED